MLNTIVPNNVCKCILSYEWIIVGNTHALAHFLLKISYLFRLTTFQVENATSFVCSHIKRTFCEVCALMLLEKKRRRTTTTVSLSSSLSLH